MAEIVKSIRGGADLPASGSFEVVREIVGVAGVDQLRKQLPFAKVAVGGPSTMLDLEVPLTAPRSTVADGPLPVRALATTESGELEGEVLLWASGGYLSALELTWYTDEVPAEWPSPDRLVLG
jgi:hypothetical protein